MKYILKFSVCGTPSSDVWIIPSLNLGSPFGAWAYVAPGPNPGIPHAKFALSLHKP